MAVTLKTEGARRPCYANGQRVLFHQWVTLYDIIAPSLMVGGHTGGQISRVFGICEKEDGSTVLIPPSEIKFADGGSFDEFVWFPEVES